ncbi:molybdopterin-dependent oxidoreductase (plasmid) [Roseobacteraceae bacterium NS-SX3]
MTMFRFAAVLAASALLSAPALAENTDGTAILTVSGQLEGTHAEAVAYSLEDLKALPSVSFTTSTIWISGDVEFTGVPLRTVLDNAGVSGSSIEAVALNDYTVEIPVAEIGAEAPVVAYLMNGKEMPARGKGPLWIVYPYDADAKYRSEIAYSRSIWQLSRIVSKE